MFLAAAVPTADSAASYFAWSKTPEMPTVIVATSAVSSLSPAAGILHTIGQSAVLIRAGVD